MINDCILLVTCCYFIIESLVQLLDLILFDLKNYFIFAVYFGHLLFYNLAAIVLICIKSSLCKSATPDSVFSNIRVDIFVLVHR